MKKFANPLMLKKMNKSHQMNENEAKKKNYVQSGIVEFGHECE